MENKDETENCCCSCLNFSDDFWNKYKKHTGKVSIGISVLGGIGAILAGKLVIAGSIVVGVTNVAIFLSGLALEKFKADNNLLEKDNDSLKNEKTDMIRRLTNYQFPRENNILRHGSNINKLISIEDYLNQDSFSNEPINSDAPSDCAQ